ncbi:DNA pilot protein [Dipodfec virus RodF1_68]|uniref:DNA pilot protein n=1 Tax=Dipodfec virus RodF1_68 TaxID=2929308 RepID=A0A976R5K2_9VIRU|nr:DNA pilot protein [Dipodfec virus RodF1_68]
MSFLKGLGVGILNKGIETGFNQLNGSLNSRREWKYAKKSLALQHQYNLEAADHSFDLAQKAWNLENEYNTPSAQMERFMAAGLNPNLIYGQQNTGGSLSAPSVSGSGLPHVSGRAGNSTFDVMEPIVALQNLAIGRENIKNLQTERGLKEAMITKVLAEIPLLNTRNESNQFDLSLKRELKENAIATAIQRLANLKSQGELFDSQKGLNAVMKGLKDKELEDWNKGIRPNDSPLWRTLLKFIELGLNRFGVSTASLYK